jgi:hypothetical protein
LVRYKERMNCQFIGPCSFEEIERKVLSSIIGFGIVDVDVASRIVLAGDDTGPIAFAVIDHTTANSQGIVPNNLGVMEATVGTIWRGAGVISPMVITGLIVPRLSDLVGPVVGNIERQDFGGEIQILTKP